MCAVKQASAAGIWCSQEADVVLFLVFIQSLVQGPHCFTDKVNASACK